MRYYEANSPNLILKITISGDINWRWILIAQIQYADTYAIKEYVTKHRAQKGSVKRFVLSALRESPEPMTSRRITELWVDDRGLRADEATLTAIRKRIGACIKTCVNQGLVECTGQTEAHDMYGPYKLWRVISR